MEIIQRQNVSKSSILFPGGAGFLASISLTVGWVRHSNAELLIRSYQGYLDHKYEVEAEATGITHRAAWNRIFKVFKRLL